METKTKKRIGFAIMDPELHRRIASAGGRAVHAKGVGHRFTPEEAREAGRKGGQKCAEDRHFMSTIGRRGGLAGRGSKKGKVEEGVTE